MKLWELLFAPAICQKYLFYAAFRVDGIFGGPLLKTLCILERNLTRSVNGIHKTSLFLPEEDYLGLLAFGGCFLQVIAFPHNPWLWKLGHFADQLTDAQQQYLIHKYHGLIVRHQKFWGGERRYLAKNPSFTAWTSTLANAFPTARFVALRRPPMQVVPSQLSSVKDGLEMFGYEISDPRIRDRFIRLLSMYYRQVDSCYRQLPAQRFKLVEFENLTQNCKGVVTQIYSSFELQMSSEYQQSLNREAENAKSYRSRHHYSLDDFGLTEQDVISRMGDIAGSPDRACRESVNEPVYQR